MDHVPLKKDEMGQQEECVRQLAVVVVAAAVSYATECERDDETCALDLESARNGAMVGVFRCVRR